MSATLSELLPLIAPYVGDAGTCITTTAGRLEAVNALNTVTRNLMKRVDSKGTLWYWCIPVYGGIFTLPTDCLEPRQVWLDGVALEQRDEFWEGKLYIGITDSGNLCNGSALIDLGDGYAIPQSLPQCEGLRLCLVAENEGDAGKIVTVVVRNQYGEEVKEEVTLAGQVQPSNLDSLVHDVISFSKPKTLGNVKMQLLYPDGLRINHALYEPWVTTASFRRKKLPESIARECRVPKLLIKGKRRFREVVEDNDQCLICDEQALAFGLMALNALKLRDMAGYNQNMLFAVNELNRELQDAVSPAASGRLQFSQPMGFQRIGVRRGFN